MRRLADADPGARRRRGRSSPGERRGGARASPEPQAPREPKARAEETERETAPGTQRRGPGSGNTRRSPARGKSKGASSRTATKEATEEKPGPEVQTERQDASSAGPDLRPQALLARLAPIQQRWGPGLALVGILLLGALLRMWHINELGFNSDEAVYAGQAAAIAQDPGLSEIFPIFRAHPLLFQFVLAIVFEPGVSDFAARVVGVVVGLLTVILVYRVGTHLYTRRVGLWAALFLAVMPYHAVVTRQALLDGPMTLFATATLYTLARFGTSHKPRWLYAAGAMMGLTFLAKEPGIVLLGSVYVFLALAASIPVRIRHIALSLFVMALIISPFPISVALGGGTETARSFLVWQLFRRPNHDLGFYFATAPLAIGPLLILVAAAGLWLLRRSATWREKLLLAWILVPVAFFEVWPVKGWQYLLPTAPAVALLAGRTVARWTPRPAALRDRWYGSRRTWRALLGGALAVSLLVPTWTSVNAVVSDRFLAGSGGVPGGREAGLWIAENIPEGARFMTIGPSMANIVQFYGRRRALGLSVSPNPLHRNPAYTPIINPDLQIRSGEIHYLVYDEFSAQRTEFFANALRNYACRYDGRVIHVETVDVRTDSGETVAKPIIEIIAVRAGSPNYACGGGLP